MYTHRSLLFLTFTSQLVAPTSGAVYDYAVQASVVSLSIPPWVFFPRHYLKPSYVCSY